MPAGRPPLYKSVEDMQSIVDEYFNSPEVVFTNPDTGQVINRPTMAGLAYALGMSRRTLVDYSHKDEVLPTIKRAREKVEVALEQNLYGNSVTGTIFNLKNNCGWVDKYENDNTETLTVNIQGADVDTI